MVLYGTMRLEKVFHRAAINIKHGCKTRTTLLGDWIVQHSSHDYTEVDKRRFDQIRIFKKGERLDWENGGFAGVLNEMACISENQ
jgi:hypothetical protein